MSSLCSSKAVFTELRICFVLHLYVKNITKLHCLYFFYFTMVEHVKYKVVQKIVKMIRYGFDTIDFYFVPVDSKVDICFLRVGCKSVNLQKYSKTRKKVL